MTTHVNVYINCCHKPHPPQCYPAITNMSYHPYPQLSLSTIHFSFPNYSFWIFFSFLVILEIYSEWTKSYQNFWFIFFRLKHIGNIVSVSVKCLCHRVLSSEMVLFSYKFLIWNIWLLCIILSNFLMIYLVFGNR